MHRPYLIWLTWIGILTLALFLRLEGLTDRPIHADEATGARLLAERLEGQDYTFNAKHFHGPILSLSAQPIAWICGEKDWASLSLRTLRLSPVLAGICLVLMPLLWQSRIGSTAALAAGALLATSPLLIYYNRMYIHESWLALFGMLSCAAIYRLLEKPNWFNGLLTGLSLGLMFATKETFAISVISWFAAAGIVYLCLASERPKLSNYWKPCLLLGITVALVSGYFYSDGLSHPMGIVDAVRTFFVYETTAGHEKAFTYYLHLLMWPKSVLGTWWSEALIPTLAIFVLIYVYKKKAKIRPLVIFLFTGIFAHLLIYSLIAYKTPWLMLLPWSLACLLAGIAFSGWSEKRQRNRITLVLMLLTGLGYQTHQSLLANGRYANDARNPYAYVPTSKDAPKIEAWLSQLAAIPGAPPLEPIAVVGQEYWPLPWYLRSFDTIGYWLTPPSDLQSFPLVFAMPAQSADCNDLLAETHRALPRGLRSHVSVTLYLRNDLWNQWMQAPSP